eukprot:12944011-Alexandrium_andersonii.AAC.1
MDFRDFIYSIICNWWVAFRRARTLGKASLSLVEYASLNAGRGVRRPLQKTALRGVPPATTHFAPRTPAGRGVGAIVTEDSPSDPPPLLRSSTP